ncbi:MAG: hypothetical protein GX587_11840, partial [Bacteroidales bacterium]|nr:hypothetical protein [Bacteroidales bacterium]
MMKQGILLFFLLVSLKVFSNDTIFIPSDQVFFDTEKMLSLSNFNVEEINRKNGLLKRYIMIDDLFEIIPAVREINVGTPYTIEQLETHEQYTMYFTQLPIISIQSDYEIMDEPSVLASFKMVDNEQNVFNSFIGIQYRGGWSQTYPKKSYEIELWVDATGNQNYDYSLLGMFSDDKWNINAMYNEPLKIRSKTSNEIWKKINKLHYQAQEPEACNGIQMEYVEVFVNNNYKGIYYLGEKINRKHLGLKKYNGSIRGELYKGSDWGTTTFSSLPPYQNSSIEWGGFEYKYPDEEVNWSNLYSFADFVINSTHSEFYNNHFNYFHQGNAVDYFIFLNLARATDNTGKNIYIAKYKQGDKYFYVPWDLDGTFGIVWDGSVQNVTWGLLKNGFYERLMHDCKEDGFMEGVANKWQDLRSDFLTHDSLLVFFSNNYQFLLNNGVYERESIAWPEYEFDPDGFEYLSNWLSDRIDYLDVKFVEPCIPIGINEFMPDLNEVIIYPNPANDYLYIQNLRATD